MWYRLNDLVERKSYRDKTQIMVAWGVEYKGIGEGGGDRLFSTLWCVYDQICLLKLTELVSVLKRVTLYVNYTVI